MAWNQIGRIIVSTSEDEGVVEIHKNCVVTGEPYSVTVRKDDYESWKRGTLAQNAFPYLSRGDREFIISGTSPKGWDTLFPPDSED